MGQVVWTAEAERYRIAYSVDDHHQDVTILGVFHGALDMERYL